MKTVLARLISNRVIYGMGLMSSAMLPLRSYEPFLDVLKGPANPLAGILAGAGFTAVVQSSAATAGIAKVPLPAVLARWD